MYKTLIAILLGVLFSKQTLSQANYVPATYVLSSGEIKRGLLDYRQWEVNPRRVMIKESQDASATAYTPITLKLFEVQNGEVYEGAILKKNIRTLAGQSGFEILQDSLVTDTVFIRVIYTGSKFSLFSFTDYRERFYIRDTSNKLIELAYGDYVVRDIYESEDVKLVRLYRNQLMQYVSDPAQLPMLNEAAEKLKYEEGSLVKFAMLLHGENGQKKQKAGSQKAAQFYVQAGAAITRFKLDNHPSLEEMSFQTSYAPAVAIGVDFRGQRENGAFFLRTELLGYAMNLQGALTKPGIMNEKKEYSYKVDIYSITPSIAPMYNFVNGSQLKCYAGLGIAVNISTYANEKFIETEYLRSIVNTRTYDEYFVFKNTWINLHVHAGLIYKQRWHLNLSHSIGGTCTNYQSFALDTKIFTAQIGYRF
jgi:hypothetical protein